MGTNDNHRTAIVLQGGGALGAYEFGVLQALWEERPGFKPAVVTGISIGAITAAVLAGAKGDPIRTLDRLWREKLTVRPRLPFLSSAYRRFVPHRFEQYLSVMGNPGMYQIRPEFLYAPWLAPHVSTSVYDLAPLRRTLAELVDLGNLNRGGIRVAVGAIDLSRSLIQYFDNKAGDLSFDHVIASGSLPPGFPMTKIDGKHYWDGGLFSNTPLGPAINHLEELDADNPDIKRELIVVELFPMEVPIPDDLPDAVSRMIQLQFTSRLKMDTHLFKKYNKFIDLLEQVDKEIPEGQDHPIRQNEGYEELRKHKRIDAFNVISAHLPSELTNALDFSEASINERAEAGYREAIEQRIGEHIPTDEQLRTV